MKLILKILGGIVVFFIVALSIGHFSGSKDYHLSIVNGSELPATVSVDVIDGASWSVPADEVLTVTLNDSFEEKTATFTVAIAGVSSQTQGPFEDWGTTVLDVTGTSCVVAADYGRQYRPKDKEIPTGESDIQVKTIYRGKQAFRVTEYIETHLGGALPETVKASHGSMPKHHRLIRVPCELTGDARALYQFLNAN
jgi:hypothetical protein